MTLRHAGLAIPAPLRSLIIARLAPAHAPRILSCTSFHARANSTLSIPARGELLDLWSSPSAQLAPPANPIVLPVPTRTGDAAELRTANEFFQAKRPQFLYSSVSWRSHEVNYYVPEVCVLGCSNAGKSTFINALLGEAGLAKSSSTPGSTRAMNAFAAGPVTKRQVAKNKNVRGTGKMDLLRSLILMDTPGYGHNSIREWGQQIEEYLQRRTMLKGVVLLIRADVPLTNWDIEVLRFLADMGNRTTIVLTRADRCGEGLWVRTATERYEQIASVLSGSGGGRRGKYAALEQGNWTPEICITAAGMWQGGKVKRGKLKRSLAKDEAGVGGARIAVLRLAGLIGEESDADDAAPEWLGETVGWDDIPIKAAKK